MEVVTGVRALALRSLGARGGGRRSGVSRGKVGAGGKSRRLNQEHHYYIVPPAPQCGAPQPGEVLQYPAPGPGEWSQWQTGACVLTH